MANVGRAPAGLVYTGRSNTAPPSFQNMGTNSGLTAHGIIVAEGNSPFVATAAGTNGQILIAATGADPAFATLTSTNGSITFTPGANSLNLSTTNAAAETLTGNSGGAIAPVAGNINTLGTGSITIAGAGSTLTTQLTGLTNHAVLVGAGTATMTNIGPSATVGQILQSAGVSADPAYSTATYPLTTTASQILFSSATNTVTGLATANRAVLTTGTTGIPVLTALATNGQLIIGSTAGAPAAGTLTSTGGTVAITPGSNTINLEAVSGAVPWTNVTGTSATMSPTNGYEANNAALVTLTMPAVGSSVFGDTIKVAGFGAGGWLIQCVATQIIHFGSLATSAGGSIASTNRYDGIEIVCSSTTTEWFCRYAVGNLTVV